MLIKDLLALNTNAIIENENHDEEDYDAGSEDKDLSQLVDEFLENGKHYSLEGRRGLVALCSLVSALGYKDHNHSMQLSQGASLGDLMNFLEDNSGAIEEVIEWIKRQSGTDWESQLQEYGHE